MVSLSSNLLLGDILLGSLMYRKSYYKVNQFMHCKYARVVKENANDTSRDCVGYIRRTGIGKTKF